MVSFSAIPGQLQYWDGYHWTPQVKSPASAPEQTIADPNYIFPQLPPRPTINLFHLKRKIFLRFLAGLLFFVGLLFVLVPGPTVASNLLGNQSEAAGKVVNLDYSSTRSKTTGRSTTTTRTCAPIVEYTVDGKKYTTKSNTYTAPCNIHIGDPSIVKYDSSNPAKGNVKESTGVMVFLIAFVIGGLALISGGVIALAKSFKAKD